MERTEPTGRPEACGQNRLFEMMRPDLQLANSVLAPFISANIAVLTWNARYYEHLAQGYKQWFDFIGHRLEEDASLAAKVRSAKEPGEIAQACSNFVEKAAKDYQDEFTVLTNLSGEMANGATATLEETGAEGTNEVAKEE